MKSAAHGIYSVQQVRDLWRLYAKIRAIGRGVGAFVQELFRLDLYKRSQGRVARQATCGVLWIIVALGTWRLNEWLSATGARNPIPFLVPLTLLLIGGWAAFRLVHLPRFADFLISVESEMNKVSWPSRGELFRASIVVMVVIFLLALVLFVYDLVWEMVLSFLK